MQIKGPYFVGISTFITWNENNRHVQAPHKWNFIHLTLSTSLKNSYCFGLSLHKTIVFLIVIHHHFSQYEQNVHVSWKDAGKYLWDSLEDNNMSYTLCTIHNYSCRSIFQYPQALLEIELKFGQNRCVLYEFLFTLDSNEQNPSLLPWVLIHKEYLQYRETQQM